LVYLTVLRHDPWKVSITPNGETSEVVLHDNSTVLMNAGSEIRYPEFLSDSIRIVQLEGQAFFKIAASDKLFIVETDNVRIL
jgi:ferric-dicitrate binding protein FerR (iron transport regulator)